MNSTFSNTPKTMSDFDNFEYYISGGDGSRPFLDLELSSQLTSLHIHIVPVSKLSKLIKKKNPGAINI